jgi:hypothetical protein
MASRAAMVVIIRELLINQSHTTPDGAIIFPKKRALFGYDDIINIHSDWGPNNCDIQ